MTLKLLFAGDEPEHEQHASLFLSALWMRALESTAHRLLRTPYEESYQPEGPVNRALWLRAFPAPKGKKQVKARMLLRTGSVRGGPASEQSATCGGEAVAVFSGLRNTK